MARISVLSLLFLGCVLVVSSVQAQNNPSAAQTRVVSYQGLQANDTPAQMNAKKIIAQFKAAYPAEYEKLEKLIHSIPVVDVRRTISYNDLPAMRAPEAVSPNKPPGCGEGWSCYCECNGYMLIVTGIPFSCSCTCMPNVGIYIFCDNCPNKFAPC